VLKGQFKHLYDNVETRPNDEVQVSRMAVGQGDIDSDLIRRWIEAQANSLTDPAHLDAMLDAQKNVRPDVADAIETAFNNLMMPILKARGASRSQPNAGPTSSWRTTTKTSSACCRNCWTTTCSLAQRP